MRKIAEKNIMPPEEITKYPTLEEADRAYDIFKHTQKDRWRKNLIYTMLKWRLRTDEGAETITDFCDEYNIDRSMLYEYEKKYPDFKRGFDIFRRSLANKDLKGAKHKRLDREVVMKYIHLLDPEWKEINKYQAELKTQEATHPSTIFVEIPVTRTLETSKKENPTQAQIGETQNLEFNTTEHKGAN